MKAVRFFHKTTGEIHRTRLVTSDETLIALNCPPEHDAIDDSDDPPINHEAQRVDVTNRRIIIGQSSEQLAARAYAVGQKKTRRRFAELDRERQQRIVELLAQSDPRLRAIQSEMDSLA